MKYSECSNCNNTATPMNESIKIDGNIYCATCFKSEFPDQSILKDKLIEQDFDPTVCSFCEEDKGDIDLPKISKYHVCETCAVDIKNRTFPNWVKAFFGGVILIVIVSFFWNWKYYQAYSDIKQSNLSFQKGDISNASLLMASASDKVPEVELLKTLTAYFKGIDYLSKDKSKEALDEFNACKPKLSADYNIDVLINQAKIGYSFENKDYEGFLSASKENLQRDTSSALSWISVASAYACVYCDKGQETSKTESIKCLERAKSIDSTDVELISYSNMVEHRLYTRKIIKREEFNKQYPNGWTKN